MRERIAVVDGIRTPFCKAAGVFKEWEADDLGAFVVRELIQRMAYPADQVDELIFGNVIQPPHATNIARVVSVKGGLPENVPAFTVNRNCASGLEAIATAMNKILMDEANVIMAGGCESMSNFPILFNKKASNFFQQLSRAKTFGQMAKTLLNFRPGFFVPDIPAIADPLCSLTMGQTAENLARDFHVTRKDQDEYAALSQQRAAKAQDEGKFAEETMTLPTSKHFNMQSSDDGIRHDTTAEGLSKLRPVFEKLTGTVTAGNSSQVTDGAAAVLLMRESKAEELGLKPLGYIVEYTYAGLDPARMGLGPAYAISKLIDKVGIKLNDVDLVEINEAFAAQVVACQRALDSEHFCQEKLGRSSKVGEIDINKLNVNGGAIGLGHPIGVSGTRLVLTLLKELKRRGLNRGIATLCVGGGQGEAALLEVQ